MSFRMKMVLYLLAIGLIPLAVAVLISLSRSRNLLDEQARQRLTAVRSIKAAQLSSYFEERVSGISLLSRSKDLMSAFYIFREYHDNSGTGADADLDVSTDEYERLWRQQSAYLSSYIETYGYQDAFIICAKHGHVLFSAAREADLGANLSSGEYRDSGLAQAWRDALDSGEAVWSDVSPYAPSNNEPAMFLAMPLEDDYGDFIAVIALQISLESIDGIMQAREGLGETEETYLVGQDLRMRSNSYLDLLGHSVQASFAGTIEENGADTLAVSRALAGESGVDDIVTYNGAMVLSSYAPIRFGGITWAVLAEIDKAEVDAPVRTLELTMLVLAAVMAGLIIGAALYIARGVVNPVSFIAERAARFAQGDIAVRGEGRKKLEAIASRRDEIGEIGRSFDSLIDYLQDNAACAEAIASGDLSMRVRIWSEDDVLGKAFESMVDQLNTFMGGVMDASLQVEAGAGQIAESSQSLSQGATEQAASMEEINSSMQELGSRTKANADNASRSNQVAHDVQETAGAGADQMNRMVQAMGEINESSQSISKIIKTIDEIAFQTNLLALNAAVEAARAGRHGKGFAVVAEEVRNLAGRSARAARETADLIEGSISRVANGSGIVDQTSGTFATIIDGVSTLADSLGEISMASNEQAQGIAQINEGLGQVDQVTQQNTANTEETASAAEELAGQAQELQRRLRQFRLRGHGAAISGASQPPAETGAVPAVTEEGVAAERRISPEEVIALDDQEFGKY